MNLQSKISIQVYSANSQPLIHAGVAVSIDGIEYKVTYNALTGAYEGYNLPTGNCEITVSAEGYESQQKKIILTEGGFLETVILGLTGMSFYYISNVKTPFQPNPSIFGVVLQPFVTEQATALKSLEKQFKIKLLEAKTFNYKNGLFIFEYSSDLSSEKKEELRKSIQATTGIKLVAPVLQLSDKSATLLTDEIIVKFKSTTTDTEIHKVLEQNDLKNKRSINYIPNAYQLSWTKGNGYDILDVCNKLLKTGWVEYAEPNIYSTGEND